MLQKAITIKRHFPELRNELRRLPDYRKRPQYDIDELIMSVIVMFIFKRGSRKKADDTAKKIHYKKNIEKIFQMKLPDMDTADRAIKQLDIEHLERIKQLLVSILIKRKVFQKFRFFDLYYNITIDGTGIHTYNYEPYPGCLHRTSKKGNKCWEVKVLEAKLVCFNGFSISIGTQMIQNPVGKPFVKQDCELKAFTRLAAKLKSTFPRLPICITGDGLYPNGTVFDICENNNWKYIFTLKDGSLKSLWSAVNILDINGKKLEDTCVITEDGVQFNLKYTGYQDIKYQDSKSRKFDLNVVELVGKSTSTTKDEEETDLRFVHVTNLPLKKLNLRIISNEGRLRWKIENEGFQEQKKAGYNLKHKYSRTSFEASQNYYQCLQIAHMINQLSQLSLTMKKLLNGNGSIESFEEAVIAILIATDFSKYHNLNEDLNSKTHIRY